jgi:NTP pyrophosphatase (non-canonical NTP hydrolase)
MNISNSFERLSEFYLGCVQEEGLRRLSLRANRRGYVFIAPSFEREKFLHEDLDRLSLLRLTGSQVGFLTEAAEDQGPNTTSRDRLFYGFPAHMDRERKVSPLFFAEVQVEGTGNGNWVLTRLEEKPPYVNHHLFRKEGYYPEQIADVQDRIEHHSGPFQEKLDLILEYLDGAPEGKNWRQVDPLPRSASQGLYSSPLLFESTYSSYTYNLERDLSVLQKYDFLQEDVTKTALAPYFDSGLGRRRESEGHSAEVLRLNDEQTDSINAALKEPLSAVTGPPGTGKSQVVVNLLADAAMSGEAVLFASKNNKAVDVVRDRIREIMGEEFDFVLRLGSRGRMDEIEEEMGDRLRQLGERRGEFTGRFTKERSRRLRKEIRAVRDQIAGLRELQESYQNAKERRREAGEKLPGSWTDLEAPRPDAIPLQPLRSALDRARALAGERKMGLLLWLKQLFLAGQMLENLRETADGLSDSLPRNVQEDVYVKAYGSDGFESVARILSQLMDYRQWTERRTAEKSARVSFEEVLEGASSFEERLEKLKRELTEACRKLLRNVWIGRLARNLSSTQRSVRRYFEAVRGVRAADPSGYKAALDRLESAVDALSSTLPVWVVTNLSVRNALPLRPGLFDLAVVDEASQCDIASAVPLLYRARRSAIIGDQKQLRHITSIREEEEKRIAQRSNASELTPRWSYVRNSLFDLAEKALGERSERPALLRSHYRSHPDIIGFSNDRFYEGRLRGMRSEDSFDVPSKWRGVRWFDVRGEVPDDIRSAYNEREIQGVLWLLGKWFEEGLLGRPDLNVGVVTPFRAQADRLQNQMQSTSWWDELRSEASGSPVDVEGPTVGTAHRFQGDERDLMIFSPVVAPGIDEFTEKWVATTDQLLNVAITRARASLQVMGHLDQCRRAGGSLAPFADYVSDKSLIQEKRMPALS